MNGKLMKVAHGARFDLRLMGVAMLAFCAVLLPIRDVVGWLIPPFLSLGLALLLYRSGAVIDRADRRATLWWGFGVPMRRTRHTVARCSEVTLSQEERQRGRGTVVVYPVRLEGRMKPLEVSAGTDRAQARRQARRIAGFLGVDFVDAVDRVPIRLSAARLGETARDTLALSAEALEPPGPLSGARTTLRSAMGKLEAVLPRRGLDPRSSGSLLTGAFTLGVGLYHREEMLRATADGGRWLVVLLLGVFPACFLLAALFRATATARLEASAAGLVLTRRWPLFHHTVSIAAHELQEIAVRCDDVGLNHKPAHPQLVLASEEQVYVLDHGLSRAELEWLREWLVYTVAHEYAQKARALAE